VMRFEKEIAFVIERYHRQIIGNDFVRIHLRHRQHASL
jgi:hypothetical protein